MPRSSSTCRPRPYPRAIPTIDLTLEPDSDTDPTPSPAIAARQKVGRTIRFGPIDDQVRNSFKRRHHRRKDQGGEISKCVLDDEMREWVKYGNVMTSNGGNVNGFQRPQNARGGRGGGGGGGEGARRADRNTENIQMADLFDINMETISDQICRLELQAQQRMGCEARARDAATSSIQAFSSTTAAPARRNRFGTDGMVLGRSGGCDGGASNGGSAGGMMGNMERTNGVIDVDESSQLNPHPRHRSPFPSVIPIECGMRRR